MNSKLKGQAGAGDLAKVIVVVAVSLIIGLYVFSTISNSINQNDMTATANASVTAVRTNTYNGFTLAAIVVIVIAAAAILRNLGVL